MSEPIRVQKRGAEPRQASSFATGELWLGQKLEVHYEDGVFEGKFYGYDEDENMLVVFVGDDVEPFVLEGDEELVLIEIERGSVGTLA
jgi:hypothetical protein